MAPLFFFLASSLNVELVYSILKGITQFGYLTLCDPKDIKEKLSRMETENTTDGFKNIINRIKIKDCNNWNSASYQDFIQNNLVQSFNSKTANKNAKILILEQRV